MTDTLLVEHADKVLLAAPAHLVPADSAALDPPSGVNPHLRYIRGQFAESDKPNDNSQMWSAPDLRAAEHTIRYAPLNMVHRVRQPVGVFLDTAATPTDPGVPDGPVTITALAGMWTHIFPFEAALVEAADEQGALFYSMECRGTHLRCGGEAGCGQQFAYLDVDSHCEHLKDRASVRHIVSPTFRGGALIVPPVQPGWASAHATVVDATVAAEASRAAEMSQLAPPAALDERQWEHLMASILALA